MNSNNDHNIESVIMTAECLLKLLPSTRYKLDVPDNLFHFANEGDSPQQAISNYLRSKSIEFNVPFHTATNENQDPQSGLDMFSSLLPLTLMKMYTDRYTLSNVGVLLPQESIEVIMQSSMEELPAGRFIGEELTDDQWSEFIEKGLIQPKPFDLLIVLVDAPDNLARIFKTVGIRNSIFMNC